MQIDWITVSAQIVNFLILVWLLKRFLYRPVLDAMDRREQRIADRLNEAEEREREAEQRLREYQHKAEDLDERRDEMLAHAEKEAEEQKRVLVENAREEVDRKRDAWRRQVEEEKEDFLDQLRRQTADAVEEATRRALSDLANAGLEQRIVETFIERLESLDEQARGELADGDQPMRVASGFELEPGLRSRLTRAIHEHLDEDADVEYAQSDELLCGIELTRGAQELRWHLAYYLEQLSGRIEESLTAEPSRAEKE